MIKKQETLIDLDNTKEMCLKLMESPHYKKMGGEGIFAIVETAKSLGIDPRQALSGGLYYVKGKVEMSARMMNTLIRSKKHSVSRDSRSNENICILHGKRADNGDIWSASFSLEEARRAGLLANSVWKLYPEDMLFARALSRLARQLFPDIIGNCYVEGEISQAKEIVEESPIAIEEIDMSPRFAYYEGLLLERGITHQIVKQELGDFNISELSNQEWREKIKTIQNKWSKKDDISAS